MPSVSTRSSVTPWLFLTPAFVVIALILLYPVFSGVRLSFFSYSMRDFAVGADPTFVGLDNFRHLFASPHFRNSIRVTLTFVGSVVALEMVVGLALALLMEDEKLKGLRLFRTLFVLPIMIAPVVVGLVWRFMYHPSYGILNYFLQTLGADPVMWLSDPGMALPSIIIADVWQWTPFVFLIVLAGLQSVPKDLTEAGIVDGCSYLQNLFHIKLPMIGSVLLVAAILRLIDAFRALVVIFVMTYGGPGVSTEVLSLHLYKTAFTAQRLGRASAVAVILLGILLILSATLAIRTLRSERR